jgi:hypothetical protein
MKFKKHKVVEHTYKWLKYIIGWLYIIGLLGIWSDSGKYLTILDNIFKIVLAGVLLYFFNPLVKTVCTDFHRNVGFSSGFILLLQTSIMPFLNPTTIVKKVFSNSF